MHGPCCSLPLWGRTAPAAAPPCPAPRLSGPLELLEGRTGRLWPPHRVLPEQEGVSDAPVQPARAASPRSPACAGGVGAGWGCAGPRGAAAQGGARTWTWRPQQGDSEAKQSGCMAHPQQRSGPNAAVAAWGCVFLTGVAADLLRIGIVEGGRLSKGQEHKSTDVQGRLCANII